MNNLSSYNWLKEYMTTSVSPEEFARELSLRAMSVEKVEPVGEKFAYMAVGLVNEVKAHPNADKLRVAVVDLGKESVEIVCGGTNLAVGMRVFVALPGAKVRWHGEGELIELKETEIRGVKSIGMICAPAEVGFEALQGGDHEIWDLSSVTDAAPGTPIAEALGLDDTMFDVEITTNRPDAMGRVGLAREAAAALNAPFAWHAPALPATGQGVDLRVAVDDARCERYMAVAVDGVKVGPSPWWLQKRLVMAGLRPVNNIVDITNYVLLEYAQPLHAFDYAQLRGGEIRVRPSVKGETMRALDGKEYTLNGEMVIADAERPVAIAGIMGGEETGTSAETTTVVFEAATFDAVVIRRSARALNCYSDSQLLFEKGLSTEALPAALARAVELACEIAGGKVASKVVDVRRAPYAPLVFPLDTDRVRAKIGIDIDDAEIVHTLTRLGFAVNGTQVTVPYWRDHDIEDAVDFTEEVARMYGYHNLPSVLPSGTPPTTPEDPTLRWERWWKRALSAAGYDEFFSLSFLSADDLAKYGEDSAQSYTIMNPLSSDQTHMRPSLLPSVLRAVENNQGHTSVGRFFELSRVYMMRAGDIPEERMQVVFGEYGYDDAELAFRSLRGTLETLLARTGVAIALSRENVGERWHPSRAATVLVGGVAVGTIGEVAPHLQRAFGVDRRVMCVMLDLEALFPQMQLTHRYVPIAEVPAITRDLSVLLDERVAFADIAMAITSNLVRNVALADIYRGNGVPEGKKSVTISLTIQAERTLTSEEADAEVQRAAKMLESTFAGILRS